MVPWECFVLWVELNLNLKQFGPKLINIMFRELPLLTRWTGPELIF